jgi:hypothetical protein
MSGLSVEVRDQDIVVRESISGFSVTYRRTADEPLLVAIDSMRRDPSPEEAAFLVRAWRAAFAKARKLGWL